MVLGGWGIRSVVDTPPTDILGSDNMLLTTHNRAIIGVTLIAIPERIVVETTDRAGRVSRVELTRAEAATLQTMLKEMARP